MLRVLPAASRQRRTSCLDATVINLEISNFRNEPKAPTYGFFATATEQTLTARVVVHEETARQLLQSQVESLRARLGEMGLTLGRFDVSQGQQQEGADWHRHGDYPCSSAGRSRNRPRPEFRLPLLAQKPALFAPLYLSNECIKVHLLRCVQG